MKGNEPDRRINNITKAEEGYTLLRGNSQQRYFSTLDEDDINVKAGLVYRLKDNVEEISQIRLGYAGRFVDDNFKATEYNLTVGHASSIPSLDNFSLDDCSEKVIRQPEVMESFSRYKQEYEQERDIRIEDEFAISDSAVRKQARAYKSVIKLDRNFHIYVHGNRNLLEQGEDEKGKFYKVYYQEEE